MEVRFYDDWGWDECGSGQGYCSTLPGIEEKKQNPIGFIWPKEETKIIRIETNVY
jgi:hypothetical protein